MPDDLRTLRARLLERRVAAGHWVGHLSSSALATATAVTAIATAARAGAGSAGDDHLVRNGLEWLIANRNADGGWGDTPDSVSNISTTALVWSALSFHDTDAAMEATASASKWIRRVAGSDSPDALASTLAERYGKDRTFSVPILTMCAISGRLGAGDGAWRLIPPLPFELATLPRRLFGILRLPVVSYALPALISMGIARHRRGRQIPIVSAMRERAAPRALGVLETLQPSNGGFLEATPLTAFVAMSLVAGGERGHPAVSRGLAFLRQSVRPDGSWPIDTNLATWTTTLTVNALGGSAFSDDQRDAIRTFLVRQQWTIEHPYTGAAPGGWAWTDLPGGVPDADDTAGAVLALSHLGRDRDDVRAAAAAGIRWLLDLQNRDGGIPTFCRGWGALPFDRSSTDLTAHALRAWAAWSDHPDRALRDRMKAATARAVQFLTASQRDDGAFVPLWFGNQRAPAEDNPVFGTARVVKGLLAVAGLSRSRALTLAQRAARYLQQAQHDDGGWGGAPAVEPSIEETAVATAALAGFGDVPALVSAARRGWTWLGRRTGGFRSFPPAPIGLYFARLWYTEDLYPLVMAADAGARLTALSGPDAVRTALHPSPRG